MRSNLLMQLNHSTNQRETPGWQYAVSSGILGWVLDAFDFFVVIFLVDTLAANFHVEKKAIVWTISIALAMRPVGALLFGSLADHFGRRRPLMICVLYFSAVTMLSAFAPNYATFVVMRALYGIGMGGYWGVGASLAVESAPLRRRGLISGLMQSGYPLGYLLAAVAMESVLPHFGWRVMFCIGFPIAILISILTLRAPESKTWELHHQHSIGKMFRVLWEYRAGFAYLLLVMTIMSCLSHGTQDLYPDFLKSAHGFARSTVSRIAIFYNICAIAASPFFGQLSESLGRRRTFMLSLSVAALALYPWAFGAAPATLLIGACFMQAGVQGTFGIIPAHLNELAPNAVRSLFPGFVYQLGVLLASPAVSIQYALQKRLGYPLALTLFEGLVIGSLIIIFGLGPERKGRDFYAADQSA
ncbi:MAG TPA: MFS transporter [Candidatus Aquilonibacter sp.]|jgi:SHS family lactate transporter-like MFS transporter|nr:MFS transporter [Candidatus Aquilonibacter sp.]